MKIAIIGAGNVGSQLATAAVTAGHDVILTAANPENAASVARDVGATAASSNQEAVVDADLVVLAVPYQTANDVLRELGADTDGTVVVDVTNPVAPDLTGLLTDTSAAEELQAAAPQARVVKAFNTIFAARHTNPTEHGEPLDAFYAGDDADAKQMVSDLASSLGYRPIDAGGLPIARGLEHMALVNMTLNARNGWPWQTAWRLVGPAG
jgi:8-hydroxy-5-deazaflavin:NADPH oxidoreductase